MTTPGECNIELEKWILKHLEGKYKSCIKINGLPILPPLMTDERRAEMRHLREMALKVESKILRRRASGTSDDAAGGEALYEGASDFTLLHCILGENVEGQPCTRKGLYTKETFFGERGEQNKVAHDMLREFDPLAPEQITNSRNCPASSPCPYVEGSENNCSSNECSGSKSNSADHSTSLSNSTDLYRYMDGTQFSPRDIKLALEPNASSPSAEHQMDLASHCANHPQRTTYEDLNNYLDIILSNETITNSDAEDNIHNSKQLDESVESDNRPKCDFLNACEKDCTNESNLSPEPLTEPLDRLQTRPLSDHAQGIVCETNVEPKDDSSTFLHECSLSPVFQDRSTELFEKKISFALEDSADFVEHQSSTKPHEGFLAVNEVSDNSNQNVIGYQGFETKASSVNLEPPPRLVRSNSYTLDSPSPLLLAHMEAELRKNTTVKSTNEQSSLSIQDKTGPLYSGRPRRVWEVDKVRNPSTWFSKPDTFSSNQLKREVSSHMPKKAQPCSQSSKVSGCVELAAITNTQAPNMGVSLSNCSGNELKVSKQNVLNDHNSKSTVVHGTSLYETCNKENISLVLSKLKLQHTKEMEELLNRQRKEQEIIKYMLLTEQASLANSQDLSSEDVASNFIVKTDLTKPASNHEANLSKSPPSKDKSPLTVSKNTSSSHHEENNIELERCHAQFDKSSFVSLGISSLESENNSELSFNTTVENGHNDKPSDTYKRPSNSDASNFSFRHLAPVFKGQISTQSSTENFPSLVTAANDQNLNDSSNVRLSARMTSSFPNSQLSNRQQNELLVTGLPSDFDFLVNLPVEIAGHTHISSSYLSAPSGIITSAVQMSHTTATSIQELSGIHHKRKSWCSRQLFDSESEERRHHEADYMNESRELVKHAAAIKIQAGVRGYLTRRLLKTERVQNCITTIRDTIVCALQLQKDCAPHVEPSDLHLHGRLIQQLSAACEDLHNIFLGLPIPKRMAIISADRRRLLNRSSRSSSSTGSRPLSRATQIALQRKSQNDHTETSSVTSTASSRSRNRRRSWASVDVRARSSLAASSASAPTSAPTMYDIIDGCLYGSFTAVESGHALQRFSSSCGSRRPWR